MKSKNEIYIIKTLEHHWKSWKPKSVRSSQVSQLRGKSHRKATFSRITNRFNPAPTGTASGFSVQTDRYQRSHGSKRLDLIKTVLKKNKLRGFHMFKLPNFKTSVSCQSVSNQDMLLKSGDTHVTEMLSRLLYLSSRELRKDVMAIQWRVNPLVSKWYWNDWMADVKSCHWPLLSCCTPKWTQNRPKL